MIVCSAARDVYADVDGVGKASERSTSSGSSSSIVSGSGGGTSGERIGNVRLWIWRVWCAMCVASAEWAVINLLLLV